MPRSSQGVTFPFNGVWLESTDGGHYWDASGNGLCRIDADAAAPGGFSETAGTCDVQAKKPTQAVVGARNADGTYFVYSADMSSKSGGPVRLTYDPAADGGKGLIVANSGFVVGGLNTVGFFADAGGNFKNSSVALGPCDVNAVFKPVTPGDPTPPCVALYLAFERSKKIERINFVDQPSATQSIETISKTADPRKGVRFGIGDFHNADGTDDLYIDELGGIGVTRLTDVAHCAPSEGSPDPTVINPPVNTAGGCAATWSAASPRTSRRAWRCRTTPTATASSSTWPTRRATPARPSCATTRTPGCRTSCPARSPRTTRCSTRASRSRRTPSCSGWRSTRTTATCSSATTRRSRVLVNPPLAKGHLFIIPGAGGVAPADCVGDRGGALPAPAAADAVTPSAVRVRHDRAQGRDHVRAQRRRRSPLGGRPLAGPVPDGRRQARPPGCTRTTRPPATTARCWVRAGRPRTTTRSCPGTTNQHYLYVAQNDHLSPGVIRFTYDPSADGGAGGLVDGSAVVMAPNAGLDGDKANGLALGPCKPGAPATCKHSLYVGGLLDGFIRRINNPEDDPRVQTVDVVAMTTEQRAGTLGKGINGSIGMLGDDLYLPENQGFTVVKGISACPTAGQVCPTIPLNIAQFGFIFGSAIGVDPDPQHLRSTAGLVYAAVSPGRRQRHPLPVRRGHQHGPRLRGPRPAAAGRLGRGHGLLHDHLHPAGRSGQPARRHGDFRFAQGLMVDRRRLGLPDRGRLRRRPRRPRPRLGRAR